MTNKELINKLKLAGKVTVIDDEIFICNLDKKKLLKSYEKEFNKLIISLDQNTDKKIVYVIDGIDFRNGLYLIIDHNSIVRLNNCVFNYNLNIYNEGLVELSNNKYNKKSNVQPNFVAINSDNIYINNENINNESDYSMNVTLKANNINIIDSNLFIGLDSEMTLICNEFEYKNAVIDAGAIKITDKGEESKVIRKK